MKDLPSSYSALFDYSKHVPIIDTHDHTSCLGPEYTDPIQVVVYGYQISDLASATSEEEAQQLIDYSIPWKDRWPVLEKAWKRANHTGYARVTKQLLKHFYNVEDITLETLEQIEDQMMNFKDQSAFEAVLAEANIALRLQNVLDIDHSKIIDKSFKLTPRSRVVIPLPEFHYLQNQNDIQRIFRSMQAKVGDLDEYLGVCREIFQAYKEFGAVAFKDQSAYLRPLSFKKAEKNRAKKIFQKLIDNPKLQLNNIESIILSDYLFNEFLGTAGKLQLPVQIHTGLLDRMYGDIRGANPGHLLPIIDTHRGVKFDLLHAGWPYSGECIFLVKNYPNVAINFCWTHMIDPEYARSVMRQAVTAVPHSKVHGFGSDHGGHPIQPPGGRPDRAWAAAEIARENIAHSLSSLVDDKYLSLDSAKEIINSWLFLNPNEFYKLGLDFSDWIK